MRALYFLTIINMYEQTSAPLHLPINPNGLGVEIYESLKRHQTGNTEKIALIDPKTKQSVTYTQLLQSTTRLAQVLERENLTDDDYIAVFSENHINFFTPVIAALYIGIPLSPLNFNYQGDELVHVLKISKPKILFCSSTVLGKVMQIREKCPWFQRIILIDVDSCPISGVITLNEYLKSNYCPIGWTPRPVQCATHTLGILCSSGTTGMPKGVELTHQNLLVRIIQILDPRYNDIVPNDTKLALLPFFHGYGFVATMGYIIGGDMVVVLKRFEEQPFLQYIQDYKIRTLFVVPPIIVTLAKSPHIEKYDFSALKNIYSGAAPLDKKIELVAKRRLKIDNIVQGYGLTEATQATLSPPMPLRQDKSGSAGVVLPGMIGAVMDYESGQLLGPNQVGEICFKGLTVMKGYLHNPQATAESFKNGWLVTGDIGYYDEDHYFYIIDRRKELIKYKSFQVAPAELEAILLSHPKVRDAAVIGVPDELAGELPMAFIVKQAADLLTADEVMKFIEDRVSNAKKLRGGVKFIDEIPKNPSGKILRRHLRDLAKKLNLQSKY